MVLIFRPREFAVHSSRGEKWHSTAPAQVCAGDSETPEKRDLFKLNTSLTALRKVDVLIKETD